jgi:hypothetical protein
MKIAHIIKVLLITLGSVIFSAPSSAAQQGTLGNSSSGSINFSVTKPPRADITNLHDMSVSSWIAGDGAVTLTNDVCVYSTRPSGSYTIRATGSASGGAFGLTNGVHTMPYSVIWNAGGVNNLSNTGESLTAGAVSNPQSNAATTSSTCSGNISGPTARLVVNISESNMISSPQGTYVGVLTLMVTPN